MISIMTDYALQLLAAGWTVRHNEVQDHIEWRRHDGVWGHRWVSNSLDDPPQEIIEMELYKGTIREVHRRAPR